VSTRHESAEMMGVSVPDLPPSSSSDNFNLGEKDSIRRRALLALEGKTDHSFNKVEIPELTTPVMESKSFDLGRQSYLSSNSAPSFGSGMSSNKRDSFKMLASSSSSKDQLGTLLEEEEEEEDPDTTVHAAPKITTQARKPVPDILDAKPRSRPAGLNLRPLSLTSKVVSTGGLPTPVTTPSPRSGLRSLTLSHSSVDSEDSFKNFSFRPSTAAPYIPVRRSSLSSNSDSEDCKPSRRSSIGYKVNGLPTPNMTPTFDRPFSEDGHGEDMPFHRPLSTSEQHFLFKQHNALLARITDLEKALSCRPRSRPQSQLSDASSVMESFTSEPTDEMLQLIADLKEQRDDLSRDIDGWRTRVSDLEKQSGLLAQRLDAERREAWVARSRVGLLEVEKAALEKSCENQRQHASEFRGQYQQLQSDYRQVSEELKRVQEDREAKIASSSNEISRLCTSLNQEQSKVATLEKELAAARATIINLTSAQPQKQHTPVPDSRSILAAGGHQKDVFVDDDMDDEEEEEEDPLAGYEDEDELDFTFQSSTSFGSEDLSSPRKTSLVPSLSRSRSGSPVESIPSPLNVPTLLPAPAQPTHVSRATLSKTWTFPKAVSVAPPPTSQSEIDRFFGCLDDNESAPSSPSLSTVPSYQTSKDMFSMGFKIRSQYFMESDEEENDEEEVNYEPEHDASQDDMVGEAGGIMITVTPCDSEETLDSPDSLVTPTEPVRPVEDEEVVKPSPPSSSIAVDQPIRSPSPSSIPRLVKSGPSSPPLAHTSPSSIPRAVKISSSPPEASKSSSPHFSQSPPFGSNHSSFTTPPTKRCFAAASPVFSTPSKSPMKPLASFNRQPSRKTPLLPSTGWSNLASHTNGSTSLRSQLLR
jgi:predicted  nucleic acid-binding Zn-ribbon protein